MDSFHHFTFKGLLVISALLLSAESFASADASKPENGLPYKEIFIEYLEQNHENRELWSVPRDLTQEAVDWGFQRLLTTKLGQDLSGAIFFCNPALLKAHLGVSSKFDFSYLKNCRQTESPDAIITGDPNQFANSTSQTATRNYQIFLHTEKTIPLVHSWTDQATKTTVIFIPGNITIERFKELLLKALAHETATYLDAKKNVTEERLRNSPIFSNVEFQAFEILDDYKQIASNLNKILTTSMQNPVIQHITGFIRSFKVERLWMSQISDVEGSETYLSEYYDSYGYPFLNGCSDSCMQEYMESQSPIYSSFALALLSDGSYWRNKSQELLSGPLDDNKKVALRVLDSHRKQFSKTMDLGAFFFNMNNYDSELSRLVSETKQIFDSYLIPDDVLTMAHFRAYVTSPEVPSSVTEFPILDWLTEPLLSNTGIKWGSGPRPRIRTNMGGAFDSATGLPQLGETLSRPPEGTDIEPAQQDGGSE